MPSHPEPTLAQRLVRQLGLRYVGPPGNGPGFYQDDNNNNIPLSLDQFGLEELQTTATTTETKADSMHPQSSAAWHNAIVCQPLLHRSALSKQMTEKEHKQLLSQTDPDELMHGFIKMTDCRGSRRYLMACRLAAAAPFMSCRSIVTK